MDRYILKGKEVIPCLDLTEWGRWMRNFKNRRIAIDMIEGIMVSTVFLGLDHDFLDQHSIQLIFETMTNDKTFDKWGDQRRYFTWDEAEEGHKKIVELVRGRIAKSKKNSVSSLDTIIEKSRIKIQDSEPEEK